MMPNRRKDQFVWRWWNEGEQGALGSSDFTSSDDDDDEEESPLNQLEERKSFEVINMENNSNKEMPIKRKSP